MFPTLFKIPGVDWPINSYGFAIMVGFLLCSYIAVQRAKPLGIKSDFILDLGIISMIAGILGAKINYLLQYSDEVADGSKMSIWGDMGLDPLGALILGPIPFAFWFWRMKRSGEKIKLYQWQTGVLMVLTLFFALLGTRALFLYHNSELYSWKVFRNWQSGFVLYGGLLTGIPAGILYIKMRRLSIATIADLCAPSIMLALSFGRIGCFLNGCCHGREGSGFPCMKFPPDSPAAREQHKGWQEWSNPVHPTQLYETAAALGFFFLLSWIYKKKRKAQGEVFLIMCMLYGVWRFLIEFLRGDKRPQWLGELSYSQVVSLTLVVGAAVWMFILRSRPPAEQPPTPPPAVNAAAPPAAPAKAS
jgi:phosphatidylglycerol:prolipoprotein diacylglycerol transferase